MSIFKREVLIYLSKFVIFLIDKSIDTMFISWYGKIATYGKIFYKKHGCLTLLGGRYGSLR